MLANTLHPHHHFPVPTPCAHPLSLVQYASEYQQRDQQEGANVINSRSIRINEGIRADELRVIGESGEQLGIISRAEALQRAEAAGLDLVEISPTASPPVAKIVNWGKYQYQKMKEQQRSRKNIRGGDIKQTRLGLKIGQNDLDIKLRKTRAFLAEGHKVKIMVFFRGREMAHQEIGHQLIQRIAGLLEEVAVVEHQPVMAGRNLSITVRAK